jgi:hypothetical protein
MDFDGVHDIPFLHVVKSSLEIVKWIYFQPFGSLDLRVNMELSV